MSGTNGTNGHAASPRKGRPRKLTDEQASALRGKWAYGASLRRLAAEFGISETTVQVYCNREDVSP